MDSMLIDSPETTETIAKPKRTRKPKVEAVQTSETMTETKPKRTRKPKTETTMEAVPSETEAKPKRTRKPKVEAVQPEPAVEAVAEAKPKRTRKPKAETVQPEPAVEVKPSNIESIELVEPQPEALPAINLTQHQKTASGQIRHFLSNEQISLLESKFNVQRPSCSGRNVPIGNLVIGQKTIQGQPFMFLCGYPSEVNRFRTLHNI
jgi:hypothetical protein